MITKNGANAIIKPITPDGDVGYDQYNQLATVKRDGDMTTMWFISDVRASTCGICGKGWDNTAESLQNQYHIGRYDRHVHKTCYVGHLSLSEYEFWHSLMASFRIRFQMEDIPNQYGGAWDTPWFTVELTDFPKCYFVLGRRKRVWSIELNVKEFKNTEPLDRLEEECKRDTITCERGEKRFLIHAWTEDKSKEYMRLLCDSINVKPYS